MFLIIVADVLHNGWQAACVGGENTPVHNADVTKVVANDYLDGRTALFTCEKCVLFVFVDKCRLPNTMRSESVCEM